MRDDQIKVFIGYDSRHPDAYMVTARSLARQSPNIATEPLVLPHLRGIGLYDRPTTEAHGVLFDDISGAAMSTEFAISRFLVPHLSEYRGLSIFVDGDFLFRAPIEELLQHMRPSAALGVVQHKYVDQHATKMDGQPQSNYRRKNWSSLMVMRNDHWALRKLSPAFVNSATGRHLHSLDWLPEEHLCALPEAWNWLEGHSSDMIEPKAVHFTRGTPDMIDGVQARYAAEWRSTLGDIA